jgi:hypothetical protein
MYRDLKERRLTRLQFYAIALELKYKLHQRNNARTIVKRYKNHSHALELLELFINDIMIVLS